MVTDEHVQRRRGYMERFWRWHGNDADCLRSLSHGRHVLGESTDNYTYIFFVLNSLITLWQNQPTGRIKKQNWIYFRFLFVSLVLSWIVIKYRPVLIRFFTAGWTIISVKNSTRSELLLLPKLWKPKLRIVTPIVRRYPAFTRQVSDSKRSLRPRKTGKINRLFLHCHKRQVPPQPLPCYHRRRVCLITGRKWLSSLIWWPNLRLPSIGSTRLIRPSLRSNTFDWRSRLTIDSFVLDLIRGAHLLIQIGY